MTSLERLRAAVDFEDYDRPPLSDNEWLELFEAMVPHFAECPARRDGLYSEEERATALRASQDMIPWHHVYTSGGARQLPYLGPAPQLQEGYTKIDGGGVRRVFRGGAWWVVERPFKDLAGAVEHLKGLIRSARSKLPSEAQDFPEKLAYARMKLAGVVIAFPYISAGLDHLYPLFTWEFFSLMTIEYPDLIGEYLCVSAENTIQRIHLIAQHITAHHCPVTLLYSDIAHNTGLLLSPAFLKQALLPVVDRITAAFHEHGIKVVYHSEGDLRKILPDLVATGIDGINTLSPAENMDPVEIRRLYPNLILWGGIENAELLVRASVDDVRREVRRVVEGVGKGLIVASSGGVHPACKVENCIAMVEALQDIGVEIQT